MARRQIAADAVARADRQPPQPIPSGPKVNRNRMMPGLRVRHDGWTEERTQRFFDALAHSGCVRDASRVAGVSNVAAYRMKRRFPLFEKAWDAALARAQVGLIAIAYKRAVEGRETVIIRNGEEYERRISPSDSMLGLLIKRGDMVGGGLGGAGGEEAITLAEWRTHRRFDARGHKVEIEDPEVTSADFVRKIETVRARLHAYAAEGGTCPCCSQSLPAQWPRQSMAELMALGVVDPDEL